MTVHLGRLLRFGIIGLATLGLYLAITAAILALGVRDPLLAAVPAFLLAVAFNYVAHRLWTFESKARHAVALPRFALAIAAGLVLNTAALWLFLHGLAWPLLLAQTAAAAVVAAGNYLALSRLVFGASPG